MSLDEDERLVRGLGMSVAHGGVAYVPADLRLTNGQTAIPELVAMSGWTVGDVADAVRAAQCARSADGEASSKICERTIGSDQSVRRRQCPDELVDEAVDPPSAGQMRERTT